MVLEQVVEGVDDAFMQKLETAEQGMEFLKYGSVMCLLMCRYGHAICVNMCLYVSPIASCAVWVVCALP